MISELIDSLELKKRNKDYIPDSKTLNMLLEMNEQLSFSSKNYTDEYANIFIVGLMRSGTTLLSQLLAKYTDLGFVNNLTAKFWKNPQYGIALSKSLNLFCRESINLSSTHGNTYEVDNVHEFGYFWADLLGHKSSPDLSEKSKPVNWELLKNKVLSINHAFGNSCVFKNTLLGHYARDINEVFKYPIFIYIKRNPLDVALSVLHVRKKRYGSISAWWSMKPKEYILIKNLDPYEQVVAQIYYLEKDLQEQIRHIPNCRLIEVNYEEICKQPNLVHWKIKEIMFKYGLDYSYSNVLEKLTPNPKKLDTRDIEKLSAYWEKYFLK